MQYRVVQEPNTYIKRIYKCNKTIGYIPPLSACGWCYRIRGYFVWSCPTGFVRPPRPLHRGFGVYLFGRPGRPAIRSFLTIFNSQCRGCHYAYSHGNHNSVGGNDRWSQHLALIRLVRLGVNPLCVHTTNLNWFKTKSVRNHLQEVD